MNVIIDNNGTIDDLHKKIQSIAIVQFLLSVTFCFFTTSTQLRQMLGVDCYILYFLNALQYVDYDLCLRIMR